MILCMQVFKNTWRSFTMGVNNLMGETFWQMLQGLDDVTKIFFLSMLPVTELRATIPLALALNIPLKETFISAYLGNILPVPFIFLLLEPLRRRWQLLAAFVEWCYRRTEHNRSNIEKYGPWGLFIFVAVPLPGTGVWSGSLVAIILRLSFWPSLIAIIGGALLAAVLVTLATVGILKLANLFSWLFAGILLALFIVWQRLIKRKKY